MIVIGISGKAGTGKSTFAGHLAAMLPGAKRASFAGILKDEVTEVYADILAEAGVTRADLDTQEGKAKAIRPPHEGGPATVRALLQYHGTDVRRAEDPDYWVQAMEDLLVEHDNDKVEYVIIDDVRFPNELRTIQDLCEWFEPEKTLTIRMEPFEGWTPGDGAEHPSETALDGGGTFDIIMRPRHGKLAEAAAVVALGLTRDNGIISGVKRALRFEAFGETVLIPMVGGEELPEVTHA